MTTTAITIPPNPVRDALDAYIAAAMTHAGDARERVAVHLAAVIEDHTPLNHWPEWRFDLDDDEVAAHLLDKYPPPVVPTSAPGAESGAGTR